MGTRTKTRDYLFDNYKALLVFLVVIGHFIELSSTYKNNEILYYMKWLIVSFHMPAFIFISGYFSKKEISLSKMIQKLLIPYIIYEMIYYLLYVYVIHKPTELYLLHPKFSLWYILALFLWRIVTPIVKKIPFHMELALLGGLLIGCSNISDNFLSLPRAIVFYPFFLAGIYFDREMVEKIREKKNLLFGVTGLGLFVGFLMLRVVQIGYSPKIFYGRYNYEFLKQGMLEGMLVRTFCYMIGFGMTFSVMLLMNEKKTRVSYIGERTMAIYLFHGLVYSYIKGTSDVLRQVDCLIETVWLLAFCIGVTMLFSWKPFTRFTNEIASVPVKNLGTHCITILESYRISQRDLVFGK